MAQGRRAVAYPAQGNPHRALHERFRQDLCAGRAGLRCSKKRRSASLNEVGNRLGRGEETRKHMWDGSGIRRH